MSSTGSPTSSSLRAIRHTQREAGYIEICCCQDCSDFLGGGLVWVVGCPEFTLYLQLISHVIWCWLAGLVLLLHVFPCVVVHHVYPSSSISCSLDLSAMSGYTVLSHFIQSMSGALIIRSYLLEVACGRPSRCFFFGSLLIVWLSGRYRCFCWIDYPLITVHACNVVFCWSLCLWPYTNVRRTTSLILIDKAIWHWLSSQSPYSSGTTSRLYYPLSCILPGFFLQLMTRALIICLLLLTLLGIPGFAVRSFFLTTVVSLPSIVRDMLHWPVSCPYPMYLMYAKYSYYKQCYVLVLSRLVHNPLSCILIVFFL